MRTLKHAHARLHAYRLRERIPPFRNGRLFLDLNNAAHPNDISITGNEVRGRVRGTVRRSIRVSLALH